MHQALTQQLRTVEPFTPRLSICICTSGRPLELHRCLDSILAGTCLPDEVIVSDDSPDPDVSAAVLDVCLTSKITRYTVGPKRGLCANRNHAIRCASGSHVSLLDDDAVVGAEFLEKAMQAIVSNPDDILTGDVVEGGTVRCPPTNLTWLGFFGRRTKAGESLCNIHLNCNVMPRRAFDHASFDERITYGYEDTDLCDQLIHAGFRIVHIPEMVNDHLPPSRASKIERWRLDETDVARVYVGVRRRLRARKPYAIVGWLPVVFLHHAGHHLTQGRVPRWGRLTQAAAMAIRSVSVSRP